MVDKLKSLVQMSEFIAANSTQTYESWTHFLQFSGRFYKYTYDEQISIYFQRPEATAVASYEIWNQQMRRYIKRGSVGIAVIDNSGNGTRFRYLFDIADTGTRQTSRTPNIWKKPATPLEKIWNGVPAAGVPSAPAAAPATQRASTAKRLSRTMAP